MNRRRDGQRKRNERRLGADELVNFSIFIWPFSLFAPLTARCVCPCHRHRHRRHCHLWMHFSFTEYLLKELFYDFSTVLCIRILYIPSTYLIIVLSLLFPCIFHTCYITMGQINKIACEELMLYKYSPVPIDECNYQISVFTENCIHWNSAEINLNFQQHVNGLAYTKKWNQNEMILLRIRLHSRNPALGNKFANIHVKWFSFQFIFVDKRHRHQLSKC